MEQTIRCMKCGHILYKKDKYCKYCGRLNIYKPLDKIIVKKFERWLH